MENTTLEQIPEIKLANSNIITARMNEKGNLCNAYSPLKNLMDDNGVIGDFTTDKLQFDLENPVDILVQDAYDGAVNLILNDGKNFPKLINTRFSVQNDNQFKIPDHIGYKDTNLYETTNFNTDTRIKKVSLTIPNLYFQGIRNNSGVLSCGSYSFYFKLSDADNNETEIVQESGIVQLHIGDVNDPLSARMGMQDESSNKSVQFLLTNIDSGFDYVHVLYVRHSSGNDLAATTSYHKIHFDYPIVNKQCVIQITGTEQTSQTDSTEFYVDYADIDSAKTQAIINNVLLLGNIKKQEHDWDALRRMSWKIIPECTKVDNVGIGELDNAYEGHDDNFYDPDDFASKYDQAGTLIRGIKTEKTVDAKKCYYNTQNVYYKTGYWPDEIYKFGIVYIFEDMSLSPVFNIQGADLSKNCSIELFFDRDLNNNLVERKYDPEDHIFNTEYLINSRGVVKFPNQSMYHVSGTCRPLPLGIKFNMQHLLTGMDLIEIKQIRTALGLLDNDIFTSEHLFKYHKIKGYFFVRLKRVPTIFGHGIACGLTGKDHGSIPVIKNNSRGSYIAQSFLTAKNYGRLLQSEGRIFNITSDVTPQALLVPDAELMEATFNQLFVGNKFALRKLGTFQFTNNGKTELSGFTTYPEGFSDTSRLNNYLEISLLNVPEDTKLVTDGESYFSTVAGSAHEAHKTIDTNNRWKYTPPQDLTESDSLVRGLFGAYVGMSRNNAVLYGDVYSIKSHSYIEMGEDQATLLDFKKRFVTEDVYSAISDRLPMLTDQIYTCYRGDCFLHMYTHRMHRNFIDPELPTNTEIVAPDCWNKNYGVRCTALILPNASSNMSAETEGWYIEGDLGETQKRNAIKHGLTLLLTGNIFGAIVAWARADDPLDPAKLGLGDNFVLCTLVSGNTAKFKLANDADVNVSINNVELFIGLLKKGYYYQIKDINFYTGGTVGFPLIEGTGSDKKPHKFSGETQLSANFALDNDGNPIFFNANGNGGSSITALYPNGFANEIVLAFEVYVGGTSYKDATTSLYSSILKYGEGGPTKKAVNPKEQEKSGSTLKAIFKCDDNWELRGLANINRADVNAVGLGTWISFPICSSHNLAFRDVDYSNATEQASFNRKRSFYPLYAKDTHNPLRDSNIINQATAISIPDKKYVLLPNMPYIKEEFFTRIHNSLYSSSSSIRNSFKAMLEYNYVDYTKQYGSITKIVDFRNNIVIVFKHGIGLATLLSDNQGNISLSKDVSMASLDIGSLWKDSVIQTDYGVYGVDTVAKKIWKFSDRLEVLSDVKLTKFLVDNIDMSEFTRTPYIGHINVKTHHNKYKNDIIFTYYNDIPYDENGNVVTLIGDNTKEAIEARNSIVKWEKGKQWSLCYNEDIQKFTTFYDWIPVLSENIDNIYFSFDKEEANYIYENPEFNKLNLIVTIDPKTTRKLRIAKYNIDRAFNNYTNVYSGRSEGDNFISVPFPIKETETKCIHFYYRTKKAEECIILTQLGTSNIITLSADRTWKSCFIFLQLEANQSFPNNSVPFYIKNGITDEEVCDIQIADLKIVDITNEEYIKLLSLELLVEFQTSPFNLKGRIVQGLSFVDHLNKDYKADLYWDIRNTVNNVKLWKHGLAGLYDNQAPIKPTHWYGKQREFNFEFIVINQGGMIQHIYNNLWIISNKAMPNKFEYEVVGEGYEWYDYKPVIHWCNIHKDKDFEGSLDNAYKYVLTHSFKELQTEYSDFPIIFNTKQDDTIQKLPYFTIKLSDRKGEKSKNYNYDDQDYMYSDDTTETILVYDPQLEEYKVHTEQLANDMKKYGRIRGNIEYLEDTMKVQIRPIAFKYAYIKDGELAFTELQETRHRDKFLRVKIRYSGEDLAVIKAVLTFAEASHA